jgi:transcription elongation factor GreA
MANSEDLITTQGKALLEIELKRLTEIEVPRLEAEFSSLANEADPTLKSTGEAAVRDQKLFLESRISEVSRKISQSSITDPKSILSDSVVFGATVILENVDREALTLKIVGVDEANIRKDKISVESRLAKVLLGKKLKDVVELDMPQGKIKYTIVELKFV